MTAPTLRINLLTFGLILSASPLVFAGDGYFPIGYGVKAQGMGGVGIALPQDGLAAAANPAGTAFVPGRADIGLVWFAPDKSASISGSSIFFNGTTSGNGKGNSFIPEFGYIKKISQTITAGLAVYGNGSMGAQYGTNPFEAISLFEPNIGAKLEKWFISPSIAYKVDEDNALGVSLNFAYQRYEEQNLDTSVSYAMSASPVVTPPSLTANIPFLPPQPPQSARGYMATSTGWGVRLGWTGKVRPNLTFGATWSSKISTGKFGKDSWQYALYERGFDIPASYGVGLAWKYAPAWTFAADVSRILYGGVNPAGNQGYLAAPNGPGFGWNDINAIKLGLSYEATSILTLRTGINHSGQAVPSGRTYYNILAPSVVQDHLTVGATWNIAKDSELSAAYVHGFRNTLRGTSPIPGDGPGIFRSGTADITAAEDSLGLAYGWKF